MLLLSMPILARADEAIVITDSLKNLPMVKEGFMYDFKHNRGLNVLGLEIVTYKGFSLDAAWMGIDGLGAVANYNLGVLPVQNVPIISYVKYLNIGYGLGWRKITSDVDGGNPRSDNQLIQGPVVFVKLKF